MPELKKCPCGKTPNKLGINPGLGFKWAYTMGDCCNHWEVEFRANYFPPDDAKCMENAIKAWNEAPRGE